MAEPSGTALVDGRYRVLNRIGSGGMAEVYSAEDTHLSRRVALKVLHRRFARDTEFVERFRREAQSAAGLQHPNIVNVFDRGRHDGTYYIAMEHLEGRTLKDVIAEEAPLPQEHAIDLGIQILRAAGFAHRRGVIHRDFKPQNAIVDSRGGVKVTDFGIARAGASEMTETGSIMGTAQYLSPEQAQGHAVTDSSDLYSIGVMLYEMLAGRLPFEGESAVAIAVKHLSEPPPPLSSLRPDVHPALEAAVMRSLAKDPQRRYRDAEEFIAALEEAREAIHSGEGPGGTAVFAPLPPVVEEVRPDDEEERRRRWPWVLLALLLLALLGAVIYAITQPEIVRVPKVERQPVGTATTTLERAGLEVEVRRRHDPLRAGLVLDQEPEAGEEAEVGSTVDLVVSSGPIERSVPPVGGLPQRQAVKKLNEAGFKVDLDSQPSMEVREGRAIRTDPPAGVAARVGSRVRLFVSSGPRQVRVPGVIGLSRASAEAQLTRAGLSVSVEQRDSEKTEGEVLDQQPEGGATVDEGSRVTITVSRGPEEPERVEVPTVTGLTAAQAARELQAAGFGVTRRFEPVESRGQHGLVQRQQPGGGTRLTMGQTVVIYVGQFTPPEPPPEQRGAND